MQLVSYASMPLETLEEGKLGIFQERWGGTLVRKINSNTNSKIELKFMKVTLHHLLYDIEKLRMVSIQ